MISAGQGPYCQDADYLKAHPPWIYPAAVEPFLFAHLSHELGFLPETEAWDLQEFKGYAVETKRAEGGVMPSAPP